MSPVLELSGIEKSFRGTRAVDRVSLTVERGEVFGLLGPNGAGKSTLLRVALDIHRPDVGAVRLFGAPLERRALDRIGYLPEERGLYKKRKVIQVLSYLGQLKGLGVAGSERAADRWLERLSMGDVRMARVESLSKGNQQKIQLIGTLLADPELLIWDEPFSGLDPLNANQVRDLLLELRDAGVAILLSTHLMAQAEALCDRVALLARGRLLLCGPTAEVRQRYGGEVVEVVTDADLSGPDWPDVASVVTTRRVGPRSRWLVTLQPGSTLEDLGRRLFAGDHRVDALRWHAPTLEEVFLRAVAEAP